jgi:hypothetical protein
MDILNKNKVSKEIRDFEGNMFRCRTIGNYGEYQKQKQLLNNYLEFVYMLIESKEITII